MSDLERKRCIEGLFKKYGVLSFTSRETETW
jgi:hypothetical protein